MFSPLRGAVHADSKEQVTMLLQGAKRIEGKGCDELNAALYSSSPAMLELLLRSGIAICDEAAVNAVVMQNRDNKEKLRILLAHGLEPNRLYTKSVLAGGVHRGGVGSSEGRSRYPVQESHPDAESMGKNGRRPRSDQNLE